MRDRLRELPASAAPLPRDTGCCWPGPTVRHAAAVRADRTISAGDVSGGPLEPFRRSVAAYPVYRAGSVQRERLTLHI